MNSETPEHTAVRVALWRALHVLLDSKPPVLDDEVGATIVAEPKWRERPDMNPEFCKPMRASVVVRTRYIEDLLIASGVDQYVILGAGLDTFAQRRTDSKLNVFEVDQPGPQTWKVRRLMDLDFSIPKSLHFVPVDFEAGESWLEKLRKNGFDADRPAFIASTGVSMYLSAEANLATFKQIAGLAKGSIFATTFMLDLALLPAEERAAMEFVMKRAAESGTPFLSLFKPEEILALAAEAGFKRTRHVSARDLFNKYLAGRDDGLNAGTAEAFLIAET